MLRAMSPIGTRRGDRATLRRLARSALSVFALLTGVVGTAPPVGTTTASATYEAPLRTAIADLPVTDEVRTGYDRDLFRHWVDADGDGCDARNEVLIAEADDPTSVGPGCALSGGRWFSYYDRVSWTDTGDIDIDHMVPLAEAWDSGAHAWTPEQREEYANDLDDYRTLVGVTDNVNQAKGDQDIAEWLPTHAHCRYLREFVAVKIRWRLAVDADEHTAMTALADGCTDATVTVTRAL